MVEFVLGAFVAREAELDLLERAEAGCREGGGSAFVAAGEAGVGKSRLLAEASLRARGEGMLVLRGRATSGRGLQRLGPPTYLGLWVLLAALTDPSEFGRVRERLERRHEFAAGSLDFVFIDHEKNKYLSDLKLILGRRWLHPGSVVVADNAKFRGAPQYRAYLKERQGRSWRAVEHDAHLVYQSLLKDLVLESNYLGARSS